VGSIPNHDSNFSTRGCKKNLKNPPSGWVLVTYSDYRLQWRDYFKGVGSASISFESTLHKINYYYFEFVRNVGMFLWEHSLPLRFNQPDLISESSTSRRVCGMYECETAWPATKERWFYTCSTRSIKPSFPPCSEQLGSLKTPEATEHITGSCNPCSSLDPIKVLMTFLFFGDPGRDGPRPDLTRAYFWPPVNRRPTRLRPRYFPTDPKRFFLIRREKNWKIWHF